jgi:hypothetical protein
MSFGVDPTRLSRYRRLALVEARLSNRIESGLGLPAELDHSFELLDSFVARLVIRVLVDTETVTHTVHLHRLVRAELSDLRAASGLHYVFDDEELATLLIVVQTAQERAAREVVLCVVDDLNPSRSFFTPNLCTAVQTDHWAVSSSDGFVDLSIAPVVYELVTATAGEDADPHRSPSEVVVLEQLLRNRCVTEELQHLGSTEIPGLRLRIGRIVS